MAFTSRCIVGELSLDTCITALASVGIACCWHCRITWVLTPAWCIGTRMFAQIPASFVECMEELTVFCGVDGLHIVTSLASRNKRLRVWVFAFLYYSIVLPMRCWSFVSTTVAFACLWVIRGLRMWAFLFDSRHCSGNFFGTCDWKGTITHNVCFVPLSSSHDS